MNILVNFNQLKMQASVFSLLGTLFCYRVLHDQKFALAIAEYFDSWNDHIKMLPNLIVSYLLQ